MLTKTEKLFLILYFVIVIAEIICGSYENLLSIHYITKPAILISLIIFFWNQGKQLSKKTKQFTLLALFFSLMGDILLMFVDNSSHFFISGLVAFVIAHLMYILVFLQTRNTKKNALPFIVLLLIYASGLFYFLKDGLGEMLIPVFVYMLIILSKGVTAFLRQKKVNRLSFVLVFAGAIFFMISDSILALNKFYKPFPFENISIMLTYALAQILIVLGIKKQQ